jgi:phage gpG-like protein
MKAEVEDNASATLQKMADRLGDLTPLMQSFGRHMMTSVRSNFLQGGRPFKWDDLKGERVGSVEETILWASGLHGEHPGKKRARKPWKREQGRARMGGPLVLTGNLKDSITFIATPNDLILTTSDGLDPMVKGPVHQWGTDRAGRNRNVVIPARPFLVFQSEDLDWFRNSALGWARTGRTPS